MPLVGKIVLLLLFLGYVAFKTLVRKKSSLEKIKTEVAKYAKDALHLVPATTEVFTKIGGHPMASAPFSWPTWQGNSLAFVMQIKFSEINKDGRIPDLPRSGLLYVFYWSEQSTWGFDPKDAGSWKVIYRQESDDLKPIAFPDDLPDEKDLPKDRDFRCRYPEKKLCAKLIKTYPAWDHEEMKKHGLSWKNDKDIDAYTEWSLGVYEDCPQHQVCGWANPEQGADMDLECTLVTNGLYCGDATGYNDPRAEELKKTRQDWMLLVQIDSDDIMWGDMGKLYFWIKKQDLEKRDFDNVWMILQCG